MELTADFGPWPMVEIAATPAEFAILAERVSELARLGTGEITSSGDPSGLASLAIRVDAGTVLVSVHGDVLTVSGAAESLEGLALNLPREPSLAPGYHVHYEHSTRESDVAGESIPLVLLVAGERGA